MRLSNLRVSGRRHLSAIGWTIICTLGLMVSSSASAYFAFLGDQPVIQQQAAIAAMALPIALGAPIFYVLMRRLRVLSFRAMRLQVIATRDGLTRFFNQTAFRRLVEHYLAQGRVGARRRAALLVIDADHFKAINDTYGHAVGDKVIRMIADKMRSVIRRRDIVGRLGGEEFGVFLMDADERMAESIAERIRVAINDAVIGEMGATRKVTVSVGGVLFDDDVDFADMFKVADSKLYEAKENGRNQVKMGSIRLADVAA